MAYVYSTFNGFESSSLEAGAGQTIQAVYQVELHKGSLTFEIQAPGGDVLWQETFTESSQGSAEVPVLEADLYIIIATAEQAGGGFELSWTLK
jgi:hypothetical protein